MNKERSGIFIFFYVLLFIITFPFYALMFLFRHILFVLFLIFMAIFVPVYNGSLFMDIPQWYQKKYGELKVYVIEKAMESENAQYIPEVVLNKVKEIKAKEVQDKIENQKAQNESYNAKVDRVDESENVAGEVRQKRGFKKSNQPSEEKDSLSEEQKEMLEVIMSRENNDNGVGGLSALIKKNRVEEDSQIEDGKAEDSLVDENKIEGGLVEDNKTEDNQIGENQVENNQIEQLKIDIKAEEGIIR